MQRKFFSFIFFGALETMRFFSFWSFDTMGQYDTASFKRGHEERLARFIKQYRIRRRDDGRLVLYKAVRRDLGSWYGGRFSLKSRTGAPGVYKPGTEVRCRRFNRDPYVSCAGGLHVTAYVRAKGFILYDRPVMVRVLVDPADIICVPFLGRQIRVKRLYVEAIVQGRRFVTE